jgi:hypothetical protein
VISYNKIKTKSIMSETTAPPIFEAKQYQDVEQVSTELIANTDYVLGGNRLASEEDYGVAATITLDGRESVDADPLADEYMLIDLTDSQVYETADGSYRMFKGTPVSADVEFMLIDRSFDPDNGVGYKGLRRGESYSLGRNNEQAESRFGTASRATSRGEHVTISVDEKGFVHMADRGSSNGTRIQTADSPLMNGLYGKENVNQGSEQEPSYEQEESPEQHSSNEQPDPRPTREQEQVVYETPTEEWDNKKEDILGQLDERAKATLARVESDYRGNVPIDIASGVIRKYHERVDQGVDGKVARKELLRLWHPDRHHGAPEDQLKMYQEVSKLIGNLE